MKELSMEEKANAYDKVAKEVKNFFEGNQKMPSDVTQTLEHLFPELKSKDDRIRKAIHIYLDWLDGRKDYAPKGEYTIRDMVTWLERQGEQKPAENSLREKILGKAKSEKQVVLISESSGQAEIDWDTRSLEDTKKLLECGLAFINKQLGVKPTELSEEDNYVYNEILKRVADGKLHENDVEYIYELLKDLRPQNKWKPTEQQLKSLRWVAEYGNTSQSEVLKELYEQLKKV